MRTLYKIGVQSYNGLLHLISPINSKAKKWVEGRKNLPETFSNIHINGSLIWFHCASLGEFEQGKPVMEGFKKEHPNWLLLVTFFSPSGYEVRKDYDLADYVFYLPAENPSNVKLFLETFKPDIAVFVKYEFWYEYLGQLFNRNIPIVFISSTFRNDQIFFKYYGKWFLKQLTKVNRFFVQDEKSIHLLNDHGVLNAEISGDTRFDRVFDTLKSDEEMSFIKDFRGANKVLIFGSAWEKETEYALQLLKQLPKEWKVIYAPHEIHEDKILNFVSESGKKCIQFTELTRDSAIESDVLVLDTVGHLARLYKYGDLAFVGGGYNDGIHNILEPLTFGLGVFFGAKHTGFPEATDAIHNGVGFEITSYSEFENLFNEWNKNEKQLELLKSKSENFIISRTGATRIIMEYLNKLT